ncbi:MAG: hypothetical protein ACOZHQ_10750 [Thermodesulfobacteriota bacterium]
MVQSLGRAVRVGAFARLAALYQALPATNCVRQGHCCGLLPPAQPIEMLAWLARAPAGGPVWPDQAAALAEHFLANAHQRRPCPWSRPGACADYDRRFLACRAYGLWSEEAYAPRRRAALAQQQAVAAAWAGLGVRLPVAVLSQGLHYCHQVRLCNPGENRPNLDAALLAVEAELEQMAQALPYQAELSACGGDLSYLVARLALGERECLALKVRATKAGLAGRQDELAGILTLARERALAWAAARPDWPEA